MNTKDTLQKIKEAKTPEDRMRTGLEFFLDIENFREKPTGYGESYLPVRDDMDEIVTAALKPITESKGVHT